MVNTLERFNIYSVTKLDNQINDKGTVKQNIIFNTIIHRSACRGHSTLQPPVSNIDMVQSQTSTPAASIQHGVESTQSFRTTCKLSNCTLYFIHSYVRRIKVNNQFHSINSIHCIFPVKNIAITHPPSEGSILRASHTDNIQLLIPRGYTKNLVKSSA